MIKRLFPACTALLIAGACSAQPKSFVVKPYLQYATQHSIHIRWETLEKATSTVEYAPASFGSAQLQFTGKVSALDLQHFHDVELSGLTAETNYFYRVSSILPGGDTLFSEIIPFHTAVKDSSAFAFTVFSDSQERPVAWGNIARLAAREHPDFALHAGDLVDLGYIKRDWVEDFFAPASDFMKKIPLYSILGNHEHDAAWYYQYFSNPAPAYRYSFRYGNAEFFMVDTDQPIGPGSEMYNWLEQALARSTATWKFVVHHYPPYSSDEDDFGDTRFQRSEQGDQDARGLVPLYEKYDVDIVFDGHIHLYERTWPIYQNKVVENNGVIYITTGGSGGDTEPPAPTRSWFTNTVREVHHFCYCTINGNKLQFKAIDGNGQLFDYFDLDGSRHTRASRTAASQPINRTSLDRTPVNLTPANRTPAAPVFLPERRIFPDTMSVAVIAALPGETITYTLDGSEPGSLSAVYTKPLLLDKTTTIRIASSDQYGRSRVNTATFTLQNPYPAVKAGASLTQGLSYKYFTGQVKDEDKEKFQHCLFTRQGAVSSPDPSLIPHLRQYWGAVYEGFIKAPSDGYYKFEGHADHIFRLHIENRLLIEELDQETNFSAGIYLKAGYHPIRIDYYNRRADRAFLEFFYTGPGIPRQPVPPSVYFYVPTLPKKTGPPATTLSQQTASAASTPLQQNIPSSIVDTAFIQEYHEPYPVHTPSGDENIRSIAVDHNFCVWIATSDGILSRQPGAAAWSPLPFPPNDNGPAYAVTVDSADITWMGTWKGVFSYRNGVLKRFHGTHGPISLLCLTPEGLYALGPNGIWMLDNTSDSFVKKDYHLPRSPRSATPDGSKGLWIATDVGLYHCNAQGTAYYKDDLLSAALRGLASDRSGRLWAAGLGGVTIQDHGHTVKTITPSDGCPSVYTTCIRRSPDGSMWVGTQQGIVRYAADGSHSLLFSRRWLLDDHVSDITFDPAGNAWIATAAGVSAIKRKSMTLAQKEHYFYDILMRRHIRSPWIAGQCHLKIAGDTTAWSPEDDDNDGEYNGNYLTMESFRYAVTKSEDARQKARKAFNFLRQLRKVTGGDGYFARTIVPIDWNDKVHDGNREFSDREIADELVKDARAKPVSVRWRKSADGQWLWKGDASSDEWCGHMMGYYFYYELVAGPEEKSLVSQQVSALADHLIAHDFNMMDPDGSHTRWSVWSPASLNHDPDWKPEQYGNSMQLLAFLKLAYHVSGDMKYQRIYLRLISEEHYLDNMAAITRQDPAWFIYYDVIMQLYLYPILIKCEDDPTLKAWYQQHMDDWMSHRIGDNNPLIDFLYSYSRQTTPGLSASIDFLRDTPLDLVSWYIDHTKREDVRLVHQPVLEDLQIDQLPPASIRMTVRWDKNPWAATGGDPQIEREPVFWLLPYWIGRYQKLIR